MIAIRSNHTSQSYNRVAYLGIATLITTLALTALAFAKQGALPAGIQAFSDPRLFAPLLIVECVMIALGYFYKTHKADDPDAQTPQENPVVTTPPMSRRQRALTFTTPFEAQEGLLSLPPEILSAIFGFLPLQSALDASLTSRACLNASLDRQYIHPFTPDDNRFVQNCAISLIKKNRMHEVPFDLFRELYPCSLIENFNHNFPEKQEEILLDLISRTMLLEEYDRANSWFTPKILAALAKHAPRLKSIELAVCKDLEQSISILGSGCREIRSVDLSTTQNISVKTIELLAKSFPNIETLDLQHSKPINRGHIRALAKCQKLRSISLSAREFTIDDMDLFAELFPGLREISFAFHLEMGDAGLAKLAKCKELKRLTLGYVNLTDIGLRAIASDAPQLEALALFGFAQVTDFGIQEIARGCKNLRVLQLDKCPLVTPNAFLDLHAECQLIIES